MKTRTVEEVEEMSEAMLSYGFTEAEKIWSRPQTLEEWVRAGGEMTIRATAEKQFEVNATKDGKTENIWTRRDDGELPKLELAIDAGIQRWYMCHA